MTNKLSDHRRIEEYLDLFAMCSVGHESSSATRRMLQLETQLPNDFLKELRKNESASEGQIRLVRLLARNPNHGMARGKLPFFLSEATMDLCYNPDDLVRNVDEIILDLVGARDLPGVSSDMFAHGPDKRMERTLRRRHLFSSMRREDIRDLERAAQLMSISRPLRTHHDIVVKKLRKHTEALALPLGRKVGSPGHAVTREYLLHRMKRTHLKPFHGESFELAYERSHPNTKQPQTFHNLVGVIPGTDRTLPPILLGAHYDSVIDAPCVDDNATSVALNLAIAEEYSLRPLDRDLVIAFFDAEEPPFFLGETMGSRRFYEDYCRDVDFAAVIVTDLIGHDFSATDLSLPETINLVAPHLRKLLCVMGTESSPLFPEILEKASKRAKGLRVFPTLYRYIGKVSDHAAFADAGQPFLFLSCGQGEHYHTPQDTLEWINFDKLGRITAYVADLIEQINATPRIPPSGTCDPFDLEMRMLREAFGLALPLGLKAMKLEIPKSREEMDALIGNVMSGKLRLK